MPPIEALPEPAEIDGLPPIEGYRAISILAMVALGLGLLSGIAVFSPLLAIVPLVAMAIRGASLWSISANSERLSGRWMAIVPFILGPLFLGWGLSREFSRRESLYDHAREFADDWLAILNRKETYLAHQLKVPSKQRMDLNLNMEVAYKGNEMATNEHRMFLVNSPVKEIVAAAPNNQFQFEEFFSHKHSGFLDTITMQYVLETPHSGKTRFWISVQRSFSIYADKSDWQLVDVSTNRPSRS